MTMSMICSVARGVQGVTVPPPALPWLRYCRIAPLIPGYESASAVAYSKEGSYFNIELCVGVCVTVWWAISDCVLT